MIKKHMMNARLIDGCHFFCPWIEHGQRQGIQSIWIGVGQFSILAHISHPHGDGLRTYLHQDHLLALISKRYSSSGIDILDGFFSVTVGGDDPAAG